MTSLRDALRDLPESVYADLLESEDEYLVVVDLPGASADTVDVTVEASTAHIEARREKDQPPEYRYLKEDRSLFLDADLRLPPDATDQGATASVENGVLELRLPKRDGVDAKRIEIDGDA